MVSHIDENLFGNAVPTGTRRLVRINGGKVFPYLYRLWTFKIKPFQDTFTWQWASPDLADEGMTKRADTIAHHSLAIKGKLKQCRNYHTGSVISYFSKIMLRVIPNKLKTKAKKLLAEEQAVLDQART